MKIRRLRALDVRCPTSRFLDGSDAVHGDPDYSAAYVVLEADSASGHGITFTIGRGTEVVCAAIRALEFLVVDRSEAEWIQLREGLANERVAAKLGQAPDPIARAALAEFRSHPLVAAARANLDANLAVVTTAWEQAASDNVPP